MQPELIASDAVSVNVVAELKEVVVGLAIVEVTSFPDGVHE